MKYAPETGFLQQYLCHFPVGWVKRQRNPTNALGFVPQPNLQNESIFQFGEGIVQESRFLEYLTHFSKRYNG